jgi:hypothetical protein
VIGVYGGQCGLKGVRSLIQFQIRALNCCSVVLKQVIDIVRRSGEVIGVYGGQCGIHLQLIVKRSGH